MMNSHSNPNDAILIRNVRIADLEELKKILEEWVIHSRTGEVLDAEISRTLENITRSIRGANNRQYLVAESAGRIIGVVGLAEPDDWMLPYSKTTHPAELVSAFVTGSMRGKGVGSSLISAIEQLATSTGHTELMINSGPRYKYTAWKLYDKLFDRVATVKNHWGPGDDAPIWRKALGPSEA